MPLPRWEDVTCECGSNLYFEAFTYRVHPSHGTARGVEEMRCIKCLEAVDPQSSQMSQIKKQKLEELKQMGVTEDDLREALKS